MTFCFTRHPYQRAVSEFFWVQKSVYGGKKVDYVEDVFKDWLRDDLSQKDSDHKLDQYLYVKGCDHVFKYADLANASVILQDIGIEVGGKMEHANRSKNNVDKITSRLSKEICLLIEELYPNDFESLGYERRYTPEPKKHSK